MKNFRDLVEKFVDDMDEIGAGAFVIVARDPDSQDTYWNRGSDLLWQRGAIEMVKDRHKDFCDEIHKDDDIEGDDWKRGEQS